MNALRTPVVLGLHPGAGTSTIAAALHADEADGAEEAADIVCVGEHALSHALSLLTPSVGPRPVLAIAAGPPVRTPPSTSHPGSTGGVRALGGCEPATPLPLLRSRFAVVVVPHLRRSQGVPAPSEEIARLLALPADHLPRPLQAYAAALRDIAAALVRSGQLRYDAPPAAGVRYRVPAADPTLLGPGTAPRPPVSERDGCCAESLDDDALEAAGFAAARRAG